MSNTLKFGNGEWYGKKDTILAYNSENNNYKPLPFTFDRASSATRVNKEGLIETVGSGEPRIDYLNDSKGALLLEPTRSNILLQSNQFDTTWSATNATLTSGRIGVGGSTDAWKLSSTASSSRIAQSISTSGQKSYTIYAKKGSLNFIRVFARDTGDLNPSVYFNLSNGTIATEFQVDDATIQDVGNGWYRCEIIFTKTISDVRIYPAIADGDLSQTSGDIYIQYSQLESGSYATSYIPTQGSIGTRVADVCNNGANDQVIGQTEGVLYVDLKKGFTPSAFEYISLSDGTTSNTIRIFFNTSNQIGVLVGDSGVTQVNLTYSNVYSESENLKVGFRYKANDFSLWVNGQEVITDNSGTVPSVNSLNFGRGDTTTSWYEKTKEIKLYNQALTDQELQALTTI